MTRKSLALPRHLAYLAYRLGCLPFVLLEGLNFPTPGEHVDVPLCCFEHAVAEGKEAIDNLQSLLKARPGPQAVAARQAIEALWRDLRAGHVWQEVPVPTPHFRELLILGRHSNRDATWKSFSGSITAFCAALPKPSRDYAALASAIADLITMRGPASYRLGHAPLETVMPHIVHLQTMWRELLDSHRLLRGLRMELSHDLVAKFSDGHLLDAVQTVASKLHRKILERLGCCPWELDVDAIWITATKAVDLSEGFKVHLSLSNLSKLARKKPPLFITRFEDKRTKDKRIKDIHLDSFFMFLRGKRYQPWKDGATNEEAAEAIEHAREQKRTDERKGRRS
jgi:hypothetical protein